MAIRERLITGLGNPGRDYFQTRHNAGFLLIDRLIERLGAREERGDRTHVLWSWEDKTTRVFLMKPTTYMNLSGYAIAAFLQQRPLPFAHMLVAYDDVALPLGAIRIRPSGSAGGQKGMRHIIEMLKTQEIPRLRLGIEGPRRGTMPLPDYVLEPFDDDEIPVFDSVLTRAGDAALAWLDEPISELMGRFNAKTGSLPEHANQTEHGGES